MLNSCLIKNWLNCCNILNDILSSGTFTDKQVKSLSILKKELQTYSSNPAAQAIINNINNYALTHGKPLS